MNTINNMDSRMNWIRNLESLTLSNSSGHYVDYEIGSECNITGVLDYSNSNIFCSPLMCKDPNYGLSLYNLRIKLTDMQQSPNIKQKNENGYYFKGGIIGELLSILSIFFGCRFFLISSKCTTPGSTSIPIKTYEVFVYKKYDYKKMSMFSSEKRNFTQGLAEFMDKISLIDPKYHQNLISSFHHYLRALKYVGIDSELVYILPRYSFVNPYLVLTFSRTIE